MKALTLVLAGLEKKDVIHFRRIFGKLRAQLDADWRITDASEADLVVLDIDSIHGHMDWLKLTANGMRTAVCTTAPCVKQADLCLSKPFDAKTLAEILAVVAAEHRIEGSARSGQKESVDGKSATFGLASNKPGAKPAARLSNSRERRPPRLVKGERASVVSRQIPALKPLASSRSPARLQAALPQAGNVGEWLLAGNFSKPVCIKFADDVWVLDPDRGAYYGPIKLKPLRLALQQPVSRLEGVDIVSLERARKQPTQPLSRLRWFAGLLALGGKLTAQLSSQGRFKLARWPQIEREYPRHFRIATAMMKEAGNVSEIAASSGAQETDVADFINANHVLGHVQLESDAMLAGTVARGSGMMSRLRSSLGR